MASTASDIARGILADLGNYAPTPSQLTAVTTWLAAEGTWNNTNNPNVQNNPLNVTLGNVKYSPSVSPSSYNYTVNSPQYPSNPVLSFTSLEAGILAGAQGIQQPFARAINDLLKAPQDVSLPSFVAAVASTNWGTWLGIDPTSVKPANPDGSNPGNSAGGTLNNPPGGGPIAQGGSGAGSSASGCVLAHTGPLGVSSPGDLIDYAQCLISHDVQNAVANGESVLAKVLPRVAAYVVGIILVIVGLVVFVQDDEVPGHEAAQAAAKAAGKAAE